MLPRNGEAALEEAALTAKRLIRDTLARRKTSRFPITDLCFWPETVARWRQEGLPADVGVHDFFGLDRVFIVDLDGSPRLEERVVEENNDTVVVSDGFGCLVKKWKSSYAPPARMKHAIDDLSQAHAYMSRYDALSACQLDLAQVGDYRKALQRGDFVAVAPLEPAWFVIEYLLGFERGLVAFIEHPRETAAIMERLANYGLSSIRSLMERGLKFDALWFSADLCYKNGMLFSPEVYTNVIKPIHRSFREFCDENGMFLMLHCDGDVRELIPLVIESGYDAIEPLEARAGNDVRLLKALYGDRITFYGNINADVVASGTQEEIREEVVSKVSVAKQGGGYIYGIDHSVPPTVSFDNYCKLIDVLKEVMYY